MNGKKRILAVDDSLTVRKMAEMVLRNQGFVVETAADGQECLDKVGVFNPDLILLDDVLPDLPSKEICDKLEAAENTQHTPVLMISSNGNAIRSLYETAANVKDYLTKPFQNDVLTSVCKHILEKAEKESAERERTAILTKAMEHRKAKEARGKGISANPIPGEVEAPGTPPLATGDTPKPRVTRPPMAAKGFGEAFTKQLRSVLINNFRQLAKFVPELEKRRADKAAEAYYLSFFVRPKLLADLVKDITNMQFGGGGLPKIISPASVTPTETLLLHLVTQKETGMLAIETPGESVQVFLSRGEVMAITSRNPRNYCAESGYNFRALPPRIVSKAVTTQQQEGVPFFITMVKSGVIMEKPDLVRTLRVLGEKALARGLVSATAENRFFGLTELPDFAREYPLNYPVRQLMLNCFRGIDDWLTIETVIGNFEAIIGRKTVFDQAIATLEINQTEADILELVDGRISVHEIINWSGLTAFEACSVLFRFVKIGLLDFIYSPPPSEEYAQAVSDDDWLTES